MESIDPIWLFGGIAMVAGVLFGVLLFRLFYPAAGDVEKLQAELEQARSDMETYKVSVNSHFNKTSDLMNELTQDYVKVYRHLADGAQTLSETREFTQILDQPQGQVLISVEAELPPDSDPLVTEVDQPSSSVAEAAPGAGNDTQATAKDSVAEETVAEETVAEETVAEDSGDAPVDYARVNENDTATEETVSTATESVVDTVKDGDENVAVGSADDMTPSKGDAVSAAETEQQAAVDESEADSSKKT